MFRNYGYAQFHKKNNTIPASGKALPDNPDQPSAPADDAQSARAAPEQRQPVPEEHLEDEAAADLDAPGEQPRREAHARGEIWFSGPPLRPEGKKVAPMVVRMHQNLGHPSQPDFTRFLNSAMAVQVRSHRSVPQAAVCGMSAHPRAPASATLAHAEARAVQP